MEPLGAPGGDNLEVTPLVVLSQTFPARPSSIPEIRDFVRRCLARSPLSEEDSRAVGATVSQALLDAAGPTGTIQVSFRIFPDHAEVDVLRSHPEANNGPDIESLLSTLTPENNQPHDGGASHAQSFADWMSDALRREGLTMEAAARQLGVSVKTVSRWVGGTTEPRLRDLRRIREVFGEIPLH
ncbi:MAG TPA: helix-turn-helix domain-containing protein [Rugosimonospora sp.]|nr:helix-turn-helix domain-containing protein [Rugosimonospora sp.]